MSETREAPSREGWSYSGDVWTNAERRAVVTLPQFVRLHRGGFEYELTPLEAECEATVVEAIAAGRFTIATSRPHVKVAWRVTPLREPQDAPASADAAFDPLIAPSQPAEDSGAKRESPPTDRGGT